MLIHNQDVSKAGCLMDRSMAHCLMTESQLHGKNIVVAVALLSGSRIGPYHSQLHFAAYPGCCEWIMRSVFFYF